METTIFQFIWKYSKRQQLILLAMTLITFPVLYVSLELPKKIINDAIGGDGSDVTILNFTLTQIQFLMLLCVGFLFAVLISGLLKMRLNTMKGVLAERLLRRFRFQLLTRALHFPSPYFRHTSQGELVSMITSEAEPMGGLMGDAISQPVFQAGQMLTILVFLFSQSLWFGLVSIALIPLQAWVIPRLQQQINQLNKKRIQEVRRLAANIGETAEGVSDIRTNGGLRYWMALFSMRLGNLFAIRFEIYQKKFFMKFLNNFINQLTPFFFYSVGGYLAIRGDISVGALVAALGAYKDLSAPWKALLSYYNQTQDMSLRWEVVTEKFAPDTIVDEKLLLGTPDQIPSLHGDIVLRNVTVRAKDGHEILDGISLTLPAGAKVAVKVENETAAQAFAELLTREVIPARGEIHVAGHDLMTLHQGVIANRIGYAHSDPYIFDGTLGDNLYLPFKQAPILPDPLPPKLINWRKEAEIAGNSTDIFECDWVEPMVSGFDDCDEIREWWFQLVEAMGIDDFMVRRALRSRVHPGTLPELTNAIVKLRPEIRQRLAEAGLDDIVHHYHPDKFNPVSPLGSNLLYALPTRMLTQETLSKDVNFVRILQSEGLVDDLANMSASLIEGLVATFGMDGTDHPLFRRLNLDVDLYQRLSEIVTKRRAHGNDTLCSEDFALMLTIPFAFSAEQIGPVFTDTFKDKVLDIRKRKAKQMVSELGGLFEPIHPEKYLPISTVLGNAIFGRISNMAGAREQQIEDIVVDVLNDHGFRRLAAQSIYDLETISGGQNLPTIFRERIAFSRAGIKKPDILILDNALASHDAESRATMRDKISTLLPNTTKIFIEKHFNSPESYDLFVEIKNGRIDGAEPIAEPADASTQEDLNQKIRAIAKTELFSGLSLQQQRLLAFSSQWFKADAGQVIFQREQPADAAYLCVKGSAGLYWPLENDDRRMVTEITPGRLIGDLAVIMKEARTLDLIAIEPCVFLRIGAEELMAVIENDAMVASSLLQSVAGHLMGVADTMQAIRDHAIEQGVDFSDFDHLQGP